VLFTGDLTHDAESRDAHGHVDHEVKICLEAGTGRKNPDRWNPSENPDGRYQLLAHRKNEGEELAQSILFRRHWSGFLSLSDGRKIPFWQNESGESLFHNHQTGTFVAIRHQHRREFHFAIFAGGCDVVSP
jgi:hypothetical protein